MLSSQTLPSRRIGRLVSLMLILLLILMTSGGLSATAHAWEGYVQDVVDGDTLIVVPASLNTADGVGVAVRLYGIDAPEMSQPGGAASKAALAAQVPQGAKVVIIFVETDKYDRAVALVSHNGVLLNREQVRLGQAIVSQKYCRARFCPEWKKLEPPVNPE